MLNEQRSTYRCLQLPRNFFNLNLCTKQCAYSNNRISNAKIWTFFFYLTYPVKGDRDITFKLITYHLNKILKNYDESLVAYILKL